MKQPMFNPPSVWWFSFSPGAITYHISGLAVTYTMANRETSRWRRLRDTLIGWRGLLGIWQGGMQELGWCMAHPTNWQVWLRAIAEEQIRRDAQAEAAGHPAEGPALMFDRCDQGRWMIRPRHKQ